MNRQIKKETVSTSTSAGVSLQFLTSITVMMSSVASSSRFLRTFTNSSVISGPTNQITGGPRSS